MLHKRIYQFLVIYLLGLAGLLLVKYSLQLSDYLIPGLFDIWRTGITVFTRYLGDVLNTLFVAVIGHILSICMATMVGIFDRLTNWTP